MCPGGALPTSVVLVICIFQCFVALFIGCCLDHPSYLALHGIAMELDTFSRPGRLPSCFSWQSVTSAFGEKHYFFEQ